MAKKEIAMLLRFAVSNFLSIREKQELSLVASTLKDRSDGLIPVPSLQGQQILPAAVIYGANASGKSNLVSAISYMCYAVLYSHNRGVPEGGINRPHFALDADFAKKPTSFDIDFIVDGTRFHYGFEASDEAFLAEWLWAFPAGKRQVLFTREFQEVRFGRNLKGQLEIIRGLMRPNSLFLSTAAQNNHEELTKISQFFSCLNVMNSVISVEFPEINLRFHKSKPNLDRIIGFMERLDTGIVGYRQKRIDLSNEVQAFQKELYTLINRFTKSAKPVSEDLLVAEQSFVELAHRGHKGEKVYFSLARESSGTLRLLLLLDAVFGALDAGSPLVIDEFDVSLHTQACEAIIALFSLPQTNKKGGQLIATTHNTNLLNLDLLRRDQIWFTEKSVEGATQLFPLTDIRTRHGDNIEKGYLQGRFGAAPYSGSPADFAAGH
jgi:AAA15 family ATPase/GTPase